MEGHVGQPRRRKPCLVAPDNIIDVLGMVVKYDCEEVTALGEVLVSRLIDMKVQALGHGAVPINMKKARYVPRQSDTYGVNIPFGGRGLLHMRT